MVAPPKMYVCLLTLEPVICYFILKNKIFAIVNYDKSF